LSVKHDLIKKRTCTLGLNGPWGETSSVFVRVTFTFPKDYPYTAVGSNPTVDIEPTPLIPLRSRAHMLRKLRGILEHRRPCLEACLYFLLTGNDGEPERHHPYIDFDTSSDEDESDNPSSMRKGRDTTVSMLHNDKNLAEPRTSQGVFGPDGKDISSMIRQTCLLFCR
jgi:WD repeat-containing protein 59